MTAQKIIFGLSDPPNSSTRRISLIRREPWKNTEAYEAPRISYRLINHMYLEIKIERNDITRSCLRDIIDDFRDIHSLNRELSLLKVAATGYAQMRMAIPHGIARRPQLEILDVCLVRG